MSLVVVGLNHKTAPLEVREKIYFRKEDENPLKQLLNIKGVQEGVILSTCNRIEVCAAVTSDAQTNHLSNFISQYHDYPKEKLEKHLYEFKEKEALRHTFRVASSLDSMVIGEPQILGQVKEAYRWSQKVNTLGPILNRVYQKAFRVAKRVRSETLIGRTPVSVGSVAVGLCQKIFNLLEDKTVLLVGAGEMMKTMCQLLCKKGVHQFYITNRTKEHAEELMQCLMEYPELVQRLNSKLSFHYLSLNEFPEHLYKMDIILVSASSPSFLITKFLMEKAIFQRKQNPIFCIDISVPRNIDPNAHSIENVYVYDMDDLQDVVKENTDYRTQEALKAEKIIAEEVSKFYGH